MFSVNIISSFIILRSYLAVYDYYIYIHYVDRNGVLCIVRLGDFQYIGSNDILLYNNIVSCYRIAT